MAFDLWLSNRSNPIICKLHKQIVGKLKTTQSKLYFELEKSRKELLTILK